MWVSGVWTKLVALVVAAQLIGCTAERLERRVGPTLAQVDGSAPVIKLHFRSGDVYILWHWSIDPTGTAIDGVGHHLGPDRRDVEGLQRYRIPLGDVTLYETNTSHTEPTAMMGVGIVLGTVVIAIGIAFIVGTIEFFNAIGHAGQ